MKQATDREQIIDEIRGYYKTLPLHVVDELWTRVVELLNLVEEKGWELTHGLRKYYYCFYFRKKRRVFGVTLFSLPTFGIWITEREAEQWESRLLPALCPSAPEAEGEAEQWESHGKPQRYEGRYACAVYPTDATVNQLHPIFEFAYRKTRGA